MIEITSIKHPAPGAILAVHCAGCGVTEIFHDYWAVAPFDGDGYYKVEMCMKAGPGNHDLKMRKFFLNTRVSPKFESVAIDPDPETMLPSIY